MATILSRSASATALVAVFSMIATPALAAPLGAPSEVAAITSMPAGWSVDRETVHRHRHWGRSYGGWGRGYRGWGHHHRHGIDAGDVLAGVLIIGGIAAIATAASRDRDRDRRVETDPNGYPYRNDRNREWEYRYRENAGREYRSGTADRGLDNAADMCTREVERTERVDEVNSVDRTSSGWRVEGRLASGRGFSCEIDNNGRVGPVDLGGSRVGATDGQWDDEAYARARSERDSKPEA